MEENSSKLYIDGAWRQSADERRVPVINPVTADVVGHSVLATAEEAEQAVLAARRAFATFSRTSVDERLDLLSAVRRAYEERVEELAELISAEVGTPISLARAVQAPLGGWHIDGAMATLRDFAFSTTRGSAVVVREPLGVVAMITPWNWPVHQIMSKVAYALAAGCTCILKPSQLAPLNATVIAEVMHEAGVPPGVFNLVPGSGRVVGEALAAHPGVDAVSITGSTAAGARVAQLAAPTIKRVTQELGGKSANILLDEVDDLAGAVGESIMAAFSNNGQSCDAPTRLLVPRAQLEDVLAASRKAVDAIRVGPSHDPDTQMGPVISEEQYDSIQRHIATALEQGARLVTGGPGSAPGSTTGWTVRPTVLADVTPEMDIFHDEVFGPVLSVTAYDTVEEAIELANDSTYGLAAYVTGTDTRLASDIARRLQAGQVRVNFQRGPNLPFGGYKRSGNGREYGSEGLLEFLETKAIIGASSTEA